MARDDARRDHVRARRETAGATGVTVHSGRAENGRPMRANACLRKPWSKRALWATKTQPSTGAPRCRRRSSKTVGASGDHRVGDAGQRLDDRRESASPGRRASSTRRRAAARRAGPHRPGRCPTSVMRSAAARMPVVSRSTKASDGANSCMGLRRQVLDRGLTSTNVRSLFYALCRTIVPT